MDGGDDDNGDYKGGDDRNDLNIDFVFAASTPASATSASPIQSTVIASTTSIGAFSTGTTPTNDKDNGDVGDRMKTATTQEGSTQLQQQDQPPLQVHQQQQQ